MWSPSKEYQRMTPEDEEIIPEVTDEATAVYPPYLTQKPFLNHEAFLSTQLTSSSISYPQSKPRLNRIKL
jgi:hypothetical protein